jgi:hypothetical protein
MYIYIYTCTHTCARKLTQFACIHACALDALVFQSISDNAHTKLTRYFAAARAPIIIPTATAPVYRNPNQVHFKKQHIVPILCLVWFSNLLCNVTCTRGAGCLYCQTNVWCVCGLEKGCFHSSVDSKSAVFTHQ